MTLEEIDLSLPHGLHDALIVSLQHDYAAAVLTLTLSLYAKGEEGRRAGELKFDGVLYCAIDPPEAVSAFQHPGELWITSFSRSTDRLPQELIEALPEGILKYSIFNRDWYSEIHVAASNVIFRWLDTTT
jgi:hypothetical protein